MLCHLNVDSGGKGLPERIWGDEQPCVLSADHSTFGSDCVTHCLKGGPGYHPVPLTGQSKNLNTSFLQLCQLGAKVDVLCEQTCARQTDWVMQEIGHEISSHGLQHLERIGDRPEFPTQPGCPLPWRTGVRTADGIEQHEIPDQFWLVPRQLDGDSSTKRVADDEG